MALGLRLRPFVRALLLLAGCAALVATSRPRPGHEYIRLEAGKVEVYALHLELTKASPVPPALTVTAHAYHNEPQVKSRLVGFLAPAVPSAQSLKELTTRGDFSLGQTVGAPGSVVFMLDPPGTQVLGGLSGIALFSEQRTTMYLTLLSQGPEPITGELSFDLTAIRAACDCELVGANVSRIPF